MKIATIAFAWTRVESEMASLFGNITGNVWLSAADTVSHRQNIPALHAMDAIQSLATRIEVFRAAALSSLHDDERITFEDIVLELRRRARERNDVVHGAWAISELFPDDVLLTQFDGVPFSYQRYTASDLEDIIARILALDDRLMRFGIDHWMNRADALGVSVRVAEPKPPPQDG